MAQAQGTHTRRGAEHSRRMGGSLVKALTTRVREHNTARYAQHDSRTASECGTFTRRAARVGLSHHTTLYCGTLYNLGAIFIDG